MTCRKCKGWVEKVKDYQPDGTLFYETCLNCGWRSAGTLVSAYDPMRPVEPAGRWVHKL